MVKYALFRVAQNSMDIQTTVCIQTEYRGQILICRWHRYLFLWSLNPTTRLHLSVYSLRAFVRARVRQKDYKLWHYYARILLAGLPSLCEGKWSYKIRIFFLARIEDRAQATRCKRPTTLLSTARPLIYTTIIDENENGFKTIIYSGSIAHKIRNETSQGKLKSLRFQGQSKSRQKSMVIKQFLA